MRAIDKLLRHKIFLQRLAASQAADWTKLIKKEFADLELKLLQGRITKRDINQYTSALKITLNKLFWRTSIGSMHELFQYELDFNYRALKKPLSTQGDLKKPEIDVQQTIEESKITPQAGANPISIPTLYNSLAVNIADNVDRRITRAIADTQDEEKNDDNSFIKSALGLSLLSSVSNIRAVANTVVNHTSAVAMDELIAANENIIEKVVWSSALDDSVCEDCAALEGQEWLVGEEREMPPLHISCRCILVPFEITDDK